MNNYLYIISLRYCPYCINTRKLLKENNIRHQDNIIPDQEKNKYKTPEISTFPQIYYVKNNLNKKKLIGGNSDLEDIIELSNNIKTDTKNMDNLINKFLSTHPRINKKLILKVLYLINKDYKQFGSGLDCFSTQIAGYNSDIFNVYVNNQINNDLIKTFIGKAIIIITGKNHSGFMTTFSNKMEVYEVLQINITRDDKINIIANLVEWECHDIYCTMRRRSEVILTPEDISKKFELKDDKDFIQFLVTKDTYKFVDKKIQDLTKLKTGDIIPIYSKYGDFEGEYLVSSEDVDHKVKNNQLFHIASINNVELKYLPKEKKLEEMKNNDFKKEEDKQNVEKQEKQLAKQEKDQEVDKQLEKQKENQDVAMQEEQEEPVDYQNSTYDISSFGFEINNLIDTFPINQNKHYDLGIKNIQFFENMVQSTSDGNWMILEKYDKNSLKQ